VNDYSRKPSESVINFQFMEPETIASKIAQFRIIYRDAFTTPPWNEPVVHAARFARHLKEISKEPGFRCVAAVKETGGMMGFAFGYQLAAIPSLHQTLESIPNPEVPPLI
jgi:hypothetical protein